MIPLPPTRVVVNHDDLYQPPQGGTFGETLRFFRHVRGLSVGAVARKAGFNHSHVSRLERGQREPTLRVLVKLADAMKLHPRERRALVEAAGYVIGEEV